MRLAQLRERGAGLVVSAVRPINRVGQTDADQELPSVVCAVAVLARAGGYRRGAATLVLAVKAPCSTLWGPDRSIARTTADR